jgi:nitrite reductase/ring-hydroxylating ferredoxin subunit
MSEVRAAPVDDVPFDRGWHVNVEGHAIVLFRVGDGVRAYGAWCPHQFADLSDGWIEDGYVVCSNHLWCFSVDDGSMPTNDLVRLPVYPSRVEDDWVLVTVTP